MHHIESGWFIARRVSKGFSTATHKTKKGVDYKAKMAEAHIMVGRAFPPYDDWNRLTLGTPGEMKAFVKVLKDFRKKGWI